MSAEFTEFLTSSVGEALSVLLGAWEVLVPVAALTFGVIWTSRGIRKGGDW